MPLTRWLFLLAILLGLAVLAATGWLFAPLFSPSPPGESERKSKLPDYDYTPWHALPVQSGRIKPFQSFAGESVRQITGRTKFEGHDPVAIVLAWLLTDGRGAGGDYTDWEHYPFILCDHHGLRQTIYAHHPEMSEEQAKGKRIAPADLRSSPSFDRLISEVAKARQELEAKAHRRLSAEHLKAEEVGRRLVLFDQLCGKATTRLQSNALCAEQFIDLKELAAVEGKTSEQALVDFEWKLKKHPDPLHLVELDQKAGSEWYSLRQLVAIRRDLAFCTVHFSLAPRPKQTIATTDMRFVLDAFALVRQSYLQGEPHFGHGSKAFVLALSDVADVTALSRVNRDSELVTRVRSSLGDPFNRVNSESRVALEAEVNRYFRLAEAQSIDLARYPGVQTIELELEYNRLQPFQWAWILMLGAAANVLVAMYVRSQTSYALGLGLYGVSILVQLLGFAARIAISGWAPVTNMYESVIFVAFIAGLLALILELIYRKKVIALAGAAVSTLGLILADQLPLALDPKISPVVPVLRTNYWLTIHVITIICGYGAGTLAWGLGNITLAMLAFGKGSDETLKMLGRFTYRAMQLTVVLLAAGTFLGGWWAAEAWGRFWGWDPKEVGALIALVCYVIPLHARYIGWVREFGLAVSAVLCYAAILLSWYIVNFVLAAGLHSYGFGGGGGEWVLWAGLVNLEWVVIAALLYLRKRAAGFSPAGPQGPGLPA